MVLALYAAPTAAQASGGAEFSQSTPAPNPNPGPATEGPLPIVIATQQADGSIIHEVQVGETLIGIAEAYDIPLADLLSLNDLGENALIYPGDRLLIQVQYTPTPTDTPTPTATSPRPTRRPPPTATKTPPALAGPSDGAGSAPAAQGPSPTPAFPSELEMDPGREPMVLVVIAGAFLFLIAPFLLIAKRKLF